MVCHFFTHGGLDLCMCSILPSLDLWYRSSICSSGPSCSTFSIPLVLVDVERSVFPISLSEADKWRRWEIAIHDAPHESRTPDRRSHVGYCGLKYISAYLRSASDGRSSELRRTPVGCHESVRFRCGVVPSGKPETAPPAADVDDVRRLFFQISKTLFIFLEYLCLLFKVLDWRDVYDGRLLTSICIRILIAYETFRTDVGIEGKCLSETLSAFSKQDFVGHLSVLVYFMS